MNKKLDLVASSILFAFGVLLVYFFAEVTKMFFNNVFTIVIPQKALSIFIWLSLSLGFANILISCCTFIFLPNTRNFLDSLDNVYPFRNRLRSWFENHGLNFNE